MKRGWLSWVMVLGASMGWGAALRAQDVEPANLASEASWLKRVVGRVFAVDGRASGIVWSYNPVTGQALITTALHSLLPDQGQMSIRSQFSLRFDDGLSRSYVPQWLESLIARTPKIESLLIAHKLSPSLDFIGGVVLLTPQDGYFMDSGAPLDPQPSVPVAGGRVIVVGFPGGVLEDSVGTIVSTEQALAVIAQEQIWNPQEPAFDPESEFLVTAITRAGMSGGGVFGPAGEYLGMVDRWVKDAQGVQYTRIVRADFMMGLGAGGSGVGLSCGLSLGSASR